jgi:hypothetical protein
MLARLDREVEVLQSLLGRSGVAEADVAELDPPVQSGQLQPFARRSFGRHLHHLVELTISGSGRRHPRQELRDLCQRRDRASGENRAGDEAAHRQVLGGDHPDADDDHARVGNCAGRGRGRDADAGDQPLAQRAVGVILHRFVPAPGEERPGTCGLDRLEAADRLDEHRLLGHAFAHRLGGKPVHRRLGERSDYDHDGNHQRRHRRDPAADDRDHRQREHDEGQVDDRRQGCGREKVAQLLQLAHQSGQRAG